MIEISCLFSTLKRSITRGIVVSYFSVYNRLSDYKGQGVHVLDINIAQYEFEIQTFIDT